MMVKRKGIYCPNFVRYGYSKQKKMFYSEFEYIDFEYINVQDVEAVEQALDILKNMPLIHKDMKIDNLKLKSEINFVIKYLPQRDQNEYARLGNKIIQKKSEVLIHGDYSFDNIGWDKKKNRMVVFDFFNACGGVCGWDRAYLIASMLNREFYKYIPHHEYELIKLIVAMKYGRGVRKGVEVNERKKLYDDWW